MPDKPKSVRLRRAVLRKSTASRGYAGEWVGLRKRYLASHPICCRCHRYATEIDHIIPIRKRPELRLCWSNLQSLCKSCHSKKTYHEDMK